MHWNVSGPHAPAPGGRRRQPVALPHQDFLEGSTQQIGNVVHLRSDHGPLEKAARGDRVEIVNRLVLNGEDRDRDGTQLRVFRVEVPAFRAPRGHGSGGGKSDGGKEASEDRGVTGRSR